MYSSRIKTFILQELGAMEEKSVDKILSRVNVWISDQVSTHVEKRAVNQMNMSENVGKFYVPINLLFIWILYKSQNVVK